MNKIINNKKIFFSFGILAILTIGFLVFPEISNAQYGYSGVYSISSIYNPSPTMRELNPSSSNIGIGAKTITIIGNGFIPSSVARINGSNRTTTFIDSSHLLIQITGNDTYAYLSNGGFFISVFSPEPGGGFSNAIFFKINNTNVSTTTNTNTVNHNTSSNFTNTNQTQSTTTNTNNTNTENFSSSNLTSNALFGSNSIYPSSLLQWVLFGILILFIIVLIRIIRGSREKYFATPLKHE